MTYKDFLTGAVFTADDADLLMRQGVIIVSNAAARDAIPSPTEGMQVYRLDTHMVERHNGTAWDPEDSGWVALTGGSGWTLGSGSQRPDIRRLGRQVYMHGEVWGGASGTLSLLIPAGFRPRGRMTLTAGRAANTVNTQQFSGVITSSGDELWLSTLAGSSIPGASPGIALGGLTWVADR